MTSPTDPPTTQSYVPHGNVPPIWQPTERIGEYTRDLPPSTFPEPGHYRTTEEGAERIPPPGYTPPPEPPRRSWFARHKILTGLIAVAALAAAVGTIVLVTQGGGGGGKPAVSAPKNLTAVDLAKRGGCALSTPPDEKALFVQDEADCLDQDLSTDANNTSFMVFGNNQGRDSWLQVAQTFGDVGVIKGDRWVVEIPDDLPNLEAAADEIQAKLGGSRVS